LASRLSDTGRGKDRTTNTLAGLVFAAFGTWVIWNSRQFESSGSVTPIFIGTALIILSFSLIATSFLAPRAIPSIEVPSGSLARRAIGAVIIVVWVALLPHLGFLPTSIAAFIALSFTVPTAEVWTVRKFVWHVVTATAVATLFWFTLTSYLGIALPETQLPFFS
jgi:hypothetical protein